MSKNVVVTGAAGLIGANLSRYLTRNGINVIAVDNLSGGYRSNIPDGCEFHNVDCGEDIDEIFASRQIDAVYHLAAYAAECLSPFIRKYNYANNVVATANVVNCCLNHNVRKIIFTSSIAVYGHSSSHNLGGAVAPTPADPYGVAKFACEQDIAIANKQHGLEYTIIRPHNVFGKYQNIWDRYRNVLGIWMRQYRSQEGLTIFGDGSQKRYFTPVEYLMEPMLRMLSDFNGETFNLGADNPITINEVVDIFRRVTDEDFGVVKVNHVEQRHEAILLSLDHSEANAAFGRCNLDFESSLREMWLWAKDDAPKEPQRPAYEVEKGMYGVWK